MRRRCKASGIDWVFHATDRAFLHAIAKGGLRPSRMGPTSHAAWVGRDLLFFGTSMTYVVPYAADYINGVILRFPRPARYVVNPDQQEQPDDAEAVTPDAVPASRIEVYDGSLAPLVRLYEEGGGYERSFPDSDIERVGNQSCHWRRLVAAA